LIARLAREPLVHFLLLGGLIFAAYFWLNPGATGEPEDDRIVIDQQQLDHLKGLWAAQWKRDPAPSDVAAIIDRYVRQEVFYREGLRMGLDRNDEIIKKRLAQKMEGVANDLATLMRPPTDEQLEAYFRSREDFFTLPAAYAFRQVLFLPDEKDGQSHIEATLASMRQGAPIPADRLNKLALPAEWPLTLVNDLDNAFGGDFTRSLERLPVGEWSGPIRSGYGWHLVFLESKQGPTLPDFASVRDYVAREYEYQSVLKAQDDVYRELLGNYRVDITAADVPPDVTARLAGQ